MFQTLIGILQTEKVRGVLLQFLKVSNPYRYSTNRASSGSAEIIARVSNPYRYSTNEKGTNVQEILAQFQTLIGILQTLHRITEYLPSGIVSNPYRYSTNLSIFECERLWIIVSNPYRYSTNSIVFGSI